MSRAAVFLALFLQSNDGDHYGKSLPQMWYPIRQDKPLKSHFQISPETSAHATLPHSETNPQVRCWFLPSAITHQPFWKGTQWPARLVLCPNSEPWDYITFCCSVTIPYPPGRFRWKTKKNLPRFLCTKLCTCNSTVNDTHPQGYVLSNLCEGTLGSISNTTGTHWDSKPFLNLRCSSFSQCNGYWQNSFNFKITFV